MKAALIGLLLLAMFCAIVLLVLAFAVSPFKAHARPRPRLVG
jgi:hypothetical protein